MRSNQFRVSQRVAAVLGCLAATAALASGCGNNGGSGDGTLDDSGGAPPAAGAAGSPSAGKSSGRAGSTGRAGSGGRAGASGASGDGGRSGGGGAAGKAGMGGASGGNNGGAAGAIGGAAGAAAGSGAAGMSAGTGGGGSLKCGNGTVDTGETCDVLKSDADNYGLLCSNTCYKVGTKACLDCENLDSCAESVHNCVGPAAKPFTEQESAACFAVMHCIQSKNCLDGKGSLGDCYCGSLNTAACSAAPFTGAGSPAGPCKAEIQAGMPDVSTNAAVLGGLTVTARPAGAAGQRLNCQKVSPNNGVTCAIPCGFADGGPAFP